MKPGESSVTTTPRPGALEDEVSGVAHFICDGA